MACFQTPCTVSSEVVEVTTCCLEAHTSTVYIKKESGSTIECLGLPGASVDAVGSVLSKVASHHLSPSLSSFRLTGIPYIPQVFLQQLLDLCPRIASLEIPAAEHPSLEPLGLAERRRKELVDLRLSRPPGAWALQQLPVSLTHLSLTECGSLHPSALVHLRSLTGLTRLSLRGLRVPVPAPSSPTPPPRASSSGLFRRRSAAAAAAAVPAEGVHANDGGVAGLGLGTEVATAGVVAGCPVATSLEHWSRLTRLQDLELLGQPGNNSGDPWDTLLPAFVASLEGLTRLAFHPPSLLEPSTALVPLGRCTSLRRLELGSCQGTPLALADDVWRVLAAAPALEQLLLGHCEPRVRPGALASAGDVGSGALSLAAVAAAATITSWSKWDAGHTSGYPDGGGFGAGTNVHRAGGVGGDGNGDWAWGGSGASEAKPWGDDLYGGGGGVGGSGRGAWARGSSGVDEGKPWTYNTRSGGGGVGGSGTGFGGGGDWAWGSSGADEGKPWEYDLDGGDGCARSGAIMTTPVGSPLRSNACSDNPRTAVFGQAGGGEDTGRDISSSCSGRVPEPPGAKSVGLTAVLQYWPLAAAPASPKGTVQPSHGPSCPPCSALTRLGDRGPTDGAVSPVLGAMGCPGIGGAQGSSSGGVEWGAAPGVSVASRPGDVVGLDTGGEPYTGGSWGSSNVTTELSTAEVVASASTSAVASPLAATALAVQLAAGAAAAAAAAGAANVSEAVPAALASGACLKSIVVGDHADDPATGRPQLDVVGVDDRGDCGMPQAFPQVCARPYANDPVNEPALLGSDFCGSDCTLSTVPAPAASVSASAEALHGNGEDRTATPAAGDALRAGGEQIRESVTPPPDAAAASNGAPPLVAYAHPVLRAVGAATVAQDWLSGSGPLRPGTPPGDTASRSRKTPSCGVASVGHQTSCGTAVSSSIPSSSSTCSSYVVSSSRGAGGCTVGSGGGVSGTGTHGLRGRPAGSEDGGCSWCSSCATDDVSGVLPLLPPPVPAAAASTLPPRQLPSPGKPPTQAEEGPGVGRAASAAPRGLGSGLRAPLLVARTSQAAAATAAAAAASISATAAGPQQDTQAGGAPWSVFSTDDGTAVIATAFGRSSICSIPESSDSAAAWVGGSTYCGGGGGGGRGGGTAAGSVSSGVASGEAAIVAAALHAAAAYRAQAEGCGSGVASGQTGLCGGAVGAAGHAATAAAVAAAWMTATASAAAAAVTAAADGPAGSANVANDFTGQLADRPGSMHEDMATRAGASYSGQPGVTAMDPGSAEVGCMGAHSGGGLDAHGGHNRPAPANMAAAAVAAAAATEATADVARSCSTSFVIGCNARGRRNGRMTVSGPREQAPAGRSAPATRMPDRPFSALRRLSLFRIDDGSMVALAGCWQLQRQLLCLSVADAGPLREVGMKAVPKLHRLERLSLLGLELTFDSLLGDWASFDQLQALELGMSRASATALAAAAAAAEAEAAATAAGATAYSLVGEDRGASAAPCPAAFGLEGLEPQRLWSAAQTAQRSGAQSGGGAAAAAGGSGGKSCLEEPGPPFGRSQGSSDMCMEAQRMVEDDVDAAVAMVAAAGGFNTDEDEDEGGAPGAGGSAIGAGSVAGGGRGRGSVGGGSSDAAMYGAGSSRRSSLGSVSGRAASDPDMADVNGWGAGAWSDLEHVPGILGASSAGTRTGPPLLPCRVPSPAPRPPSLETEGRGQGHQLAAADQSRAPLSAAMAAREFVSVAESGDRQGPDVGDAGDVSFGMGIAVAPGFWDWPDVSREEQGSGTGAAGASGYLFGIGNRWGGDASRAVGDGNTACDSHDPRPTWDCGGGGRSGSLGRGTGGRSAADPGLQGLSGGWEVDSDSDAAVRWAAPIAVQSAVRRRPLGDVGGGSSDERVHGGRHGVSAVAAAAAEAVEAAEAAPQDIQPPSRPAATAPCLTDNGLQVLLQLLPRLKELHLHNLPHLTPATVEQVLSRSGLRSLQVDGCRQLTPDCCELLSISAMDLTAAAAADEVDPSSGGLTLRLVPA